MDRSPIIRLLMGRHRTVAVFLIALLAVGPVVAVPRLVSAGVAQSPLSNSEEESGHEDHKSKRLIRPSVGPPPVPAPRIAERVLVAHRPSPPQLPQRPIHPAHGLNGPHLRC